MATNRTTTSSATSCAKFKCSYTTKMLKRAHTQTYLRKQQDTLDAEMAAIRWPSEDTAAQLPRHHFKPIPDTHTSKREHASWCTRELRAAVVAGHEYTTQGLCSFCHKKGDSHLPWCTDKRREWKKYHTPRDREYFLTDKTADTSSGQIVCTLCAGVQNRLLLRATPEKVVSEYNPLAIPHTSKFDRLAKYELKARHTKDRKKRKT